VSLTGKVFAVASFSPDDFYVEAQLVRNRDAIAINNNLLFLKENMVVIEDE
jgi:hypothetical protein